jgi:peptide/nickel transport system substrate-binding protein
MKRVQFSRRHFLGTASGIAAAAAIGGAPKFARAQGQRVANVRMQRDISSLDPGFMVGGSEIDVQTAIMPELIEYAFDGDQLTWVKTAFTKDISQSDDGLQIQFTLNPGLQWSNGFGELTAEDVKFSFERMLTSDWSGNWEALDRVDVTGTHSGTIILKRPFAPFWLNTLCGGTGFVICKKAVEAAGGKYTLEVPATCGPYVYEWTPKQRVVLTRNPDWTGPKPDYDVINYINVEEDKAAELAYEAGEVDVTRITPETYARYLKAPLPDTKTRVAGALQYMWMGMNTQHPKLQDIRVRQAIQHAVDVDSILQGAYAGVTERAYGIVPPPLPGRRTATKIDYNPEKSRALLSEAGVSGLEIDLSTLNHQARLLAAQIIQANLATVGIQARVVPLDSGPFWDLGQESKGEAWKESQLWLMRFGSEPDPFGPFQWFVKDQVGVWNWERWTDPEFDELYAKGLSEADPAKRSEIYLRMQDIMEDTGAYVWITHEPEVFVHRTTIEPDIWPTGQLNFRNFKSAG